MSDDSTVAQDDLAEILRALGLGDHARPESPHGVVQSKVLPAIRQLVAADPCAEFPDAPDPEPYRPAPGTRARRGRKEAPNIYLHTDDNLKGLCIGRLDKAEYSALVIEALDFWLEVQRDNDALRAASRAGIDVGAAPYPELYAIMRDAEALLAGRNAGDPELIHQELRRMRGLVDRAIRVVEDAGEGEDAS